ncbi:hypothetical protein EDB86DRAFT_2833285 [Lactarius hatsudake]|nr:hypothetical protein EDB86DRAFT_2833285 [Lactarius hatsudake]
MACAACAFLPAQDIRDPSKTSVAFISPSTPSSRAPSAPAIGATSPNSKPSCAISTPILLPREMIARTSGRPALARQLFCLHKAQLADPGGAGAWHGWGEEIEFGIDDGGVEDSVDAYEHYMHVSPTLHLPHLLRALGPSSLYYVFGRRRILIYTHLPVEAALPLPGGAYGEGPNIAPESKGNLNERINILGIVTLHNIDVLERESRTNRGWILCMTDAVFLGKLQHHKLVIDLTSYTPTERGTTTQPGLQLTIKEPYARRRFSTVRFTRSDVKLVCSTRTTTALRARITLWPPFCTWADACGEDISGGDGPVVRETSGRGPGPRANNPGSARARVHTETGSKGAGRRTACTMARRTTILILLVTARRRGRRGAGALRADAHYARVAPDVFDAQTRSSSSGSRSMHAARVCLCAMGGAGLLGGLVGGRRWWVRRSVVVVLSWTSYLNERVWDGRMAPGGTTRTRIWGRT